MIFLAESRLSNASDGSAQVIMLFVLMIATSWSLPVSADESVVPIREGTFDGSYIRKGGSEWAADFKFESRSDGFHLIMMRGSLDDRIASAKQIEEAIHVEFSNGEKCELEREFVTFDGYCRDVDDEVVARIEGLYIPHQQSAPGSDENTTGAHAPEVVTEAVQTEATAADEGPPESEPDGGD